jgi:hypothetical protein
MAEVTAMATAGAMVEVTAIDRLFPNGATSALPHYWSHRLPPGPGVTRRAERAPSNTIPIA